MRKKIIKVAKVCFVIFVYFHFTQCEDVFLLVNKYEPERYYCITNSSFALSWVLNDTTKILEGESDFIPKPQKFADIKCNETTHEKWKCKTSLFKEIILDRRWEELEVHKNNYSDTKLIFVTVLKTLKNDFVVPLSVRIINEAHIFLCDGENVAQSNCYWFLVEGFAGARTAVRKCPSGTISSIKGNPPGESCKNSEVKLTLGAFSNLVSNQEWKHFLLSKQSNIISLTAMINGSMKQILEFKDESITYNVTHMFVHSSNTVGLWKIHKIRYFHVTEVINRERLGPTINVENDFVCLSMFIKTCNSCQIRLELRDADNKENIFKNVTFEVNSSWHEIEFKAQNVTLKNVDLLVSTLTNSSQQNQFWSFGSIKRCYNTRFRMITRNERAGCQLMSPNGTEVITIGKKLRRGNNDERRCTEDHTVSSHCLSCSWFMNDKNCGKLKICEKQKTEVQCSCSVGYKADRIAPEDKCSVACDKGFYGYSCQNKCKCTSGTCDHVDGTCSSLGYKESYSGVSTGTITILKTKAEKDKLYLAWEAPDSDVNKYTVTYQLISYPSCANQNLVNESEKLNFATENTSIVLDHLQPYSTYQVVVSTANKNPQLSETVNLTTLSSDEIGNTELPEVESVTAETRKVTIQFSSVPCSKIHGPLKINVTVSCSNKWCKTSKSETLLYSEHKHEVSVGGLYPFSNYTLQIKFCRNDFCKKKMEDFCTRPEAPYGVRDLLVYRRNESSVSVRWKPPYPPTGTVEKYSVQCASGSEIFSLRNVTTDMFCNLWHGYMCYTCSQLNPDRNYSVTIHAKNKETLAYGQTKTVNAVTKIDPPGAPLNFSIFWTLENDLELTWAHPVEANGDIQFFNISVLQLNGRENENIRRSIAITKPIATYREKIESNFLPSTRYKIVVQAYNGYYGFEAHQEELSPPSIPLFETDPEISSTNTTIDLKITPQIRNVSRNNDYKMFILINDKPVKEPNIHLRQFEQKFHVAISKFKVLYECNLNELNVSDFVIGRTEQLNNCKHNSHDSLKPGNSYNITILLQNTYQNMTSYKVYSYEYQTQTYKASPKETQNTPQDTNLLPLLSLLLIIPIVLVIYIKRRPIIAKYDSICGRNSPDVENPENDTLLTSLPTIQSKKIKVPELEEYIKESLSSGELERQHALFPRGQTKPWKCGARAENKSKNRYTNLIAYDHTRVVLEKIEGKEHSDYINANYIDGYRMKKAYIATQGPKISTVHDFWRMVWQEHVEHIVMLANIYEAGKKKVEKYWPDKGKSLPFGDITVHYTSSKMFANFEHRTFDVIYMNEKRRLQQYHFLSWPDHGVPLYSQSLVPLLETIQKLTPSTKSPIVVHCSAGVGRTGTVLLCDICLRMAAKESAVDILRTLQQLREQRPNMVDNIQQYKLAHLVILEYLCGFKSEIACNEIEEKVEKLIASGEISKQMRYLEETAWKDQAVKTVAEKNHYPVDKKKNRFQHIFPEIQGSIFLPRYPSHDDSSTYINAVTVDGFQNPGRFIVTQQPMPNTLGDFWRLVHEKEVSVVVSLNEINLEHKTSCLFWPSAETPELQPVEYITLKHVDTLSLSCYDVTTIHLSTTDNEEYKKIDIYCMTNWPAGTNCPKKIEDFVTFLEESSAFKSRSDPIVVTCFDGALACGLYVAMSFIIEKMKMEQVCDVCQAVRNVRHNRSQFVTNEEQFEFLYKAAVIYINGFQIYANFS